MEGRGKHPGLYLDLGLVTEHGFACLDDQPYVVTQSLFFHIVGHSKFIGFTSLVLKQDFIAHLMMLM